MNYFLLHLLEQCWHHPHPITHCLAWANHTLRPYQYPHC